MLRIIKMQISEGVSYSFKIVVLCFYHIGILRHCKIPHEVHDG